MPVRHGAGDRSGVVVEPAAVFGGQRRIVLRTDSLVLRKILDHLGLASKPPLLAPARAALRIQVRLVDRALGSSRVWRSPRSCALTGAGVGVPCADSALDRSGTLGRRSRTRSARPPAPPDPAKATRSRPLDFASHRRAPTGVACRGSSAWMSHAPVNVSEHANHVVPMTARRWTRQGRASTKSLRLQWLERLRLRSALHGVLAAVSGGTRELFANPRQR